MANYTNRRHFIELVPFVGVALLAACSPKTETVVVPAETPAVPPVLPALNEVQVAKGSADNPVATSMPLVSENDAQAVSLGYVADTARVDKVKFKAYFAGSQCSGCSLYLGKTGDAAGGCPLFQGKRVSANGWCSAWVKKA